MRTLLALSLAMLITPMVAKADFVVDDFSAGQTFQRITAGTTVSSQVSVLGGTRVMTITNANPGFSQFSAGSEAVDLIVSVPGNSISFAYSLANTLDLHSSGAFPGSPLLLDMFNNVLGTWELLVTYSSDIAGSASFAPIAISSSTNVVSIDGTALGNGLLASNVDDIILTFTATSVDGVAGVAQIISPNASISAVPEPASLALASFAISSLGGMGYLRRRRNVAAPVA